MLKKINKSQIGIFVVIAVVLLLVSVFLISQDSFDFFSTQQAPSPESPFVDIVNFCIEDFGREGVFKLGFQGGTINISPQIANNPNRFTEFGFKIPNWDTQSGGIPTIESMEEELSKYIFENAKGCISSNLANLTDEFDITYDFENFNVIPQINKENVQFTVEFPIEVSRKNSEERISVRDYFINLENVRLGNLYELALEIYNLESQTYFFEELVLDQIYSSSDYSSPLSMPSEGMSFTCSKRFWTKDQLKSNLANLNNNNFPYLYFEGTYFNDLVFDANLNSELGTEQYREYYNRNYRFNLPNTQASFSNYRVSVLKPSVEITGDEGYLQSYPFRTFEVTPSSGQLIKPISMKINLGTKIPIPCIQIYHHLYTLDYDLIITLDDMNEDGNGYFFRFPMRIQIEDNIPKTRSFNSPSVSLQEFTANNEVYCADEQRIYPVDILVKDIRSDNYLSNVNISYNCINLMCEDLGYTQRPFFRDIERINALPKLETNVSFCLGGQVIANKEGYHQIPNKQRLDTRPDLIGRDINLQYFVEMVPLKSFPITEETFFAIFRETNEGYRVFDERDGSFFITIENQEYNFLSEGMWPNDGTFLNNISFINMPGEIKYNISIIFVGPDLELRGFIDYSNYSIDINSGIDLRLVVPASTQEITTESFLEFYDYLELIKDNPNYGVLFR